MGKQKEKKCIFFHICLFKNYRIMAESIVLSHRFLPRKYEALGSSPSTSKKKITEAGL
jgi:hypothetical protein